MPFLNIICFLDRNLKSAESIGFDIVELGRITSELFVLIIPRLIELTLSIPFPSGPSSQFPRAITFLHQEKMFLLSLDCFF